MGKFTKIKRFKGFWKHLIHFIGLTVIIFIFVGLGHLFLLFNNVQITILGLTLSLYVSYFAVGMSFLMAAMGIYYMRALMHRE